MSNNISSANLQISQALYDFIEKEACPGTGINEVETAERVSDKIEDVALGGLGVCLGHYEKSVKYLIDLALKYIRPDRELPQAQNRFTRSFKPVIPTELPARVLLGCYYNIEMTIRTISLRRGYYSLMQK